MAQQEQIQLVSMRMWVQSLALLSGLRIRHYHELWCRSQMPLDTQIQHCGISPRLGTSICHRYTPKKKTE